jgi:hypothetical protein
MWLCRLLTTLAIGETYVPGSPLVISFDGSGNEPDTMDILVSNPSKNDRRSMTPPGTELFEQAINLLHIAYEEPQIEHVEVLNLIVSVLLMAPEDVFSPLVCALSTKNRGLIS